MPRASSATEVTTMTNDGKQPTPGYREDNPKPSHGKPKVPGEGHPRETQNMPKQKPGENKKP
jgi:hypothetical protein